MGLYCLAGEKCANSNVIARALHVGDAAEAPEQWITVGVSSRLQTLLRHFKLASVVAKPVHQESA
ncbi:MAG: hypothetical protein A3H44_04620 [Gammaproteobacteria bacterium RIFCSPLOWO2_02_FULL_57_10]|nr:MAG: hypothetical protein A3H44_04620 [Gammaproteobacteria bacterium RIFCSPLOWO2_02_FULL_57_10]